MNVTESTEVTRYRAVLARPIGENAMRWWHSLLLYWHRWNEVI
jgi:hypothetical protein